MVKVGLCHMDSLLLRDIAFEYRSRMQCDNPIHELLLQLTLRKHFGFLERSVSRMYPKEIVSESHSKFAVPLR